MRTWKTRRNRPAGAYVWLLLLWLGLAQTTAAQTTTVTGVVSDAKTRAALPYVSVAVPQAWG